MFKDNGGWNGDETIRVFFFTPNKDKDEKEVMAEFRKLCKEDAVLSKESMLCFQVKLKHHKKTQSGQWVLFLACPDSARLEDVLAFVVSAFQAENRLRSNHSLEPCDQIFIIDRPCGCFS